MIGKARRPSKESREGDGNLFILFIAVAAIISAYFLIDYSEFFRIRQPGEKREVELGLVPSPVSPVEIITPAESTLGCDFRSNRDNVIYGGKVKLSWNCAAAERCSFDGAEGYGPVNSGIEVMPENTRRYILECFGRGKSEVFAKTVGVFEFVIREISSSGDSPGLEEKIEAPLEEKTSE